MSAAVPFDVFLAETAAARPEQYEAALAEGARLAAITPEEARAEFERMKAYILSYYRGVRPVGSFLDRAGQTFDCVPFDQQPTVRAARAAGHPVARHGHAPAALPPEASHRRQPLSAAPPAPRCPEGTVPLPRLTLDRLARLGTLDNFFRKIPGPAA